MEPEKGGTKARSLVVRREGRAGFRNNYEDDDDMMMTMMIMMMMIHC
jgi:hypothetical protein